MSVKVSHKRKKKKEGKKGKEGKDLVEKTYN